MKPLPLDYQVREALKVLARYEHVSKADFVLRNVGRTTIALLLDSGLATISRSRNGGILYTITAAGKARLLSGP
ncbi:MAG: hypothetical protein EON58_00630 [Alphaproteobacteria bacterium]|nr:MAG: hypothetical protein EON58_00630 [Alphaproteobacteria bacterium]